MARCAVPPRLCRTMSGGARGVRALLDRVIGLADKPTDGDDLREVATVGRTTLLPLGNLR